MEQKSARTGAIAALLLVVGPLLAFLGIVRPIIGFVIFVAGGGLGIAALVTGIVSLARGGVSRGTGNLIIGAVITLVFLGAASRGRGVPRINDITTDTANPPTFVAALTLPEHSGQDMAYDVERFAAEQKAGYPDLQAQAMNGSPDEVFAKVAAVAKTMPNWEIIRADPEQRALEGFETSGLFRFRDDFVIEVREGANGGSLVHMRSKSRVGKGDLGANAGRIKRFFAALNPA